MTKVQVGKVYSFHGTIERERVATGRVLEIFENGKTCHVELTVAGDNLHHLQQPQIGEVVSIGLGYVKATEQKA